MKASQLAGLGLIALPIVFNAAFFALQSNFSYPDILRRPTAEILERFQAGGPTLVAMWYVFMFSAVLFVPVAVLVGQAWLPSAPRLMALAVPIGILAGAVQVLGLVRWPFLVPYLAEAYTAPTATPASRDAVEVVFQAFHRFAGVAIGEHLGYLFTGLWTVLVAVAVWQSAADASGLAGASGVRAAFGLVGLVAAVGIWAGLLEGAGFEPAGLINAMSYVLWSLWALALGVFHLLRG